MSHLILIYTVCPLVFEFLYMIYIYLELNIFENLQTKFYCLLFSSPEHEVLMVSYCDQSMSVVRRQQFVLKANSS